MAKPRIAVDLDDTLKEFMKGFLIYHERVHGFSKPFDEMTDFTFWPLLNIPTRQEAIKRVTDFYSSQEGAQALALPDSLGALSRLKHKYDFIVVTARSDESRSYTSDWVGRNFEGVFKDIYFANSWSLSGRPAQRKVDMCRSLGARALIDDNPTYVNECRQEGLPAFLVKRPWNEKRDLSALDWKGLEPVLQGAEF